VPILVDKDVKDLGEEVYTIGHDERSSQLTPNVADPLTASDYKQPLVVFPNVVGSLCASDAKRENGQDVNKFPCVNGRLRRLTPTECERLQGLPDGYTAAAGSDSARYKAIGNGMAQPCADFVLRRIVEVENAEDT